MFFDSHRRVFSRNYLSNLLSAYFLPGAATLPWSASLCFSARSTADSRETVRLLLFRDSFCLGSFLVTGSTSRSFTLCSLTGVVLMMREEHHSSSVPGEFVFALFSFSPSLPSTPRHLHSLHAAPRPCWREALPRLLCTGECEASAHRRVTQPHRRYIHRFDENVFIIRFLSLFPSLLPIDR